MENLPVSVIPELECSNFQLTTGATNDYFLKSNALGVGTWAAASGGGGGSSFYDAVIPTDYTTLNEAISARKKRIAIISNCNCSNVTISSDLYIKMSANVVLTVLDNVLFTVPARTLYNIYIEGGEIKGTTNFSIINSIAPCDLYINNTKFNYQNITSVSSGLTNNLLMNNIKVYGRVSTLSMNVSAANNIIIDNFDITENNGLYDFNILTQTKNVYINNMRKSAFIPDGDPFNANLISVRYANLINNLIITNSLLGNLVYDNFFSAAIKEKIILQNNTFYGSSVGILLQNDSSTCIISNNVHVNNDINSVIFLSSSNTCKDLIINNNIVNKISIGALYEFVSIDNNIITRNIQIFTLSYKININNNIIKCSSIAPSNGINMTAACSDITINGNIIMGDINLGAASSIVLSNNKFVNLIASTLGTVLATGNYTTGTGIPGHLAIHPNSTGNV
jgi:hypothetical protein